MYNIGNQGKIMRKLLGKPTVESSHEPNNHGIISSSIPQFYRPSASQNAEFFTGAPIACLDQSPDGRAAVLAGRHILRTVRFDGLAISDGIDLRALISAQPTNKNNANASTSDQLSVKDVKWARGHGDATIFTACANGKIFQYDLTRIGSGSSSARALDFIQIREDSRQVNTLDINPHRGTYLLSGGQDGIVRCFDIRAPVASRLGPTFRAVQGFKCNADAVRHVKWSPKDGFYFACGTDQGVVLKWDIRKANAPILRINAHEKACTGISWHPDGEHIISAGWDSRCHVWDVSKTADRRQKPKYTISTPAPVADVAWRPGLWSATARGKRAAQIAVSYDESSQKRYGISSVDIWDLARPTMPFKEIGIFESSPSALLWHDQDLLWTAGQDGLFTQCDVAFAPKVIDRTPVSTMTFSAQGDVLMFLDERVLAQRPRASIVPAETISSATHSYSSSPNTPMLSISRSDSEDDVVGSFLGPRRKALRKRRTSLRSTNALSTTPPTSQEEPILTLDQGIKATGQYRTQQAMAVGPIPSASNVDVYRYLASTYLEVLETELPYAPNGMLLNGRVAHILEMYAQAADAVSQFRLAQTWRILAYATDLLLSRRAIYHLEERRRKLAEATFNGQKKDELDYRHIPGHVLASAEGDGGRTPRKNLSSGNLADRQAHRSLLAEEFETTSNVPTPLARPADNTEPVEGQNLSTIITTGKRLTPVFEPDNFSLPPAAHPHSLNRLRLDSMPLSDVSKDSDNTQMSSTEGYDFYDMETMAQAIDVPLSRDKQPLSLEYIEQRTAEGGRIPVNRHDSDESFGQMFSISDGSRRDSSLTESSDNSLRRLPTIDSVAENSGTDGGDSFEEDYGSRIRGHEIQVSPERLQHPFVPRSLSRTATSLTGTTTDEYLMPTQTTDDSFDSMSRAPNRNTIVYTQKYEPKGNGESLDVRLDETSPSIIESDYLPRDDDPPYPYLLDPEKASGTFRVPSPLNPYVLISRALSFETRSSALNASALVLLFKSLVPEDVIDPLQATAILRQQHLRLMGMKHFMEATLLRKLCLRGWPEGPLTDWGDDYQSIYSQAQHGVNTGFFCSSCRKPREIDRLTHGDGTVWKCERCRAVMGPCAVCGHRDSAGAVVEAGDVQGTEDSVMSTWWYCPGCGHGGHSTCIEGWHSSMDTDLPASPRPPALDGSEPQFSDGCCPLDGCGHACLPGRWRSENIVARTEEVSRLVREAGLRSKSSPAMGSPGHQQPQPQQHHYHPLQDAAMVGPATREGSRAPSGEFGFGVRGDGNEIAQSRAVESVRETLANDAGVAVAAGAGSGNSNSRITLSASPGSSGDGVAEKVEKERERRKSVKFASEE